ncbi:RNA polymerase sigma factor [Mucilaginibacter sp. SG564]|uniref:RNA polymerase sigma factor n=1 Tax=unclassified Mucilaginibacter TaxID=2617802 RepID=UPI0015540306|nr:RNA polymerase sigma-70 factor [Mucilaginibacter sp. SG564]NOW98067.1 RNA polymerase sigma-70 factor (ECF subfamily) [Mucilaginibacter sp. SG564]
MHLNNCSDSELWEEVTRDNPKAFETLFERYWSVIYSTAFSYLRDRETCSEIVQDIFLNIWQKRNEFKISCLKNYLTSAARYHVYKKLKVKRSTAILYIENYDHVSTVNNVTDCVDENITYLELEKSVEISLNNLPKRCREIFLLSRRGNLTNDEIAQQLGISKRTVENQITTALKFLRSILKNTAIIILAIIKLF